MSDCTKKGQGGLGTGGRNKRPGFALFLSLLPSISLSQWGFKVCFGVQLQLVYSLSKPTKTSEFSNIVACALVPCFGRGKKVNDGVPNNWTAPGESWPTYSCPSFYLFIASSSSLFYLSHPVISAVHICDNSCPAEHLIIIPASKSVLAPNPCLPNSARRRLI